MIIINQIPIFLLFFSVVFLVDLFLSKSSIRRHFIDIPDVRKIHQIQIPRVGGIGIIIGFFTVFLFLVVLKSNSASYFIDTQFGQATLVGMAIVFLLGFFDDYAKITVSVKIKFAAQFLFAILTVYIFEIRIEYLQLFGNLYNLGVVGPILSVIWIVGVMNAFNIIDGIDGLSASITLITITIASLVLFLLGDTLILHITFPIFAIILGFLVLNYPPASLFAGDTGSLFFGSFAALLSLKIGTYAQQGVESIVVLLIVALPVMEVFVSMFRRFYYGISENKNVTESLARMVQPDNLHMHHRLIFQGFTHEQALRFLIFFSLSVSSLSLVFILTDNLIIEIGALVYSLFFIIQVFIKLEYAQSIMGVSKGDTPSIQKNITLVCSSDYFANALKYYINGTSYFLTEIEGTSPIPTKTDTLVIYSSEAAKQYIKKIPPTFHIPIFIIANDVTLKDFNGDKRIFIVHEPVDIPYLLHDVEMILKKGLTSSHHEKTLTIASISND